MAAVGGSAPLSDFHVPREKTSVYPNCKGGRRLQDNNKLHQNNKKQKRLVLAVTK